jgi:cell division inhibitor SulA
MKNIYAVRLWLLLLGLTLMGAFLPARADVITIYTPSMGVNILKGTSVDITWWFGHATNVKIELHKIGGATTELSTPVVGEPNTGGTWPATGLFSHTFSEAAGAYEIIITSIADPTTTQTSAAFNIIDVDPTAYITEYAPAAGVNWLKDQTYNIVWTDNISENVVIYLCDAAGVVIEELSPVDPGPPITSIGTASDGSFSWTPTVAGTFRIRIESIDHPADVYALSSTFQVINTDPSFAFAIDSPSVGEQWLQNNSKTISWRSNVGAGEDVKLELFQSDGVTLESTLSASTPNDGSFSWAIGATTTGDYKIKISWVADPTVYAFSGIFSVIDLNPTTYLTEYVPAPGEKWIQGSTHSIIWTSNVSGNVDVELYEHTDLITPVTTITDIPSVTLASAGSISHVFTEAVGTYKVKVTSVDYPSVYSWSHEFQIIGEDPSSAFAIDNPSTGEVWLLGDTKTIRWRTNIDPAESIKLELYQTDGTTLVGAIDLSELNDGSFSWTISPLISTGNYKIKITWLGHTNYYAFSGVFTLAEFDPNFYITHWSPSAGEAWVLGSTHNIVWTSNISPAGTVTITLLDDNGNALAPGVFDDLSDGAIANNGSYAWTIDDDFPTAGAAYAAGTYRMKVESVETGVYVVSSPFTLVVPSKKSASGLKDDGSGINLTFYPNPVRDILNLEAEAVMDHVWIMNSLGKVVLEKEVSGKSLQLNLSGLNSGVYFVKVSSGDKMTTQKLMVK